MLGELIFAMILTLELVPQEGAAFSMDLLEESELVQEYTVEREDGVARFRDADGEVGLTVERALTSAHVYTAFPADEAPRVVDVGEALEELSSFETGRQQRITAAPSDDDGELDWTLAIREGQFYLGIPSLETVLVVHEEIGS
ncbi:MAG: hypothetical protein ACLFUM_08195 [Spirochaetaceae bacterium]